MEPFSKSGDNRSDFKVFRRQFLLTINDDFDLLWKKEKILEYNLFYHPELEFSHSTASDSDFYLLGFIYDHKNPEFSNKQILDILSREDSYEAFCNRLTNYSGHYVIVLRMNNRLILMNDACAQQEIYYDISYSNFGSQPKLLNKYTPSLPHSSPKAADFYSSSTVFKKEKVFIGDTTHAENIKHLRPNHYIDISHKSVKRYFPISPINPISIEKAANEATELLKGFLKAASLRNKLYMGVTGGIDSRVLFLASLDLECKYYVTKHDKMRDTHHDIVVPQKLTAMYNKEFRVEIEKPLSDEEYLIQEVSIDFPRDLKKPDEKYSNHVLINGNLSEIGRSVYDDFPHVGSRELTVFYGYPGSNFVRTEVQKWIDENSEWFSKTGYNLMDMFYWEERMANISAKAKTEMSSMGKVVYSPFCSHSVLTTLLSTPRKLRDPYINTLHKLMVKKLSRGMPEVPINPSKRKMFIRLLKTLKLYNISQRIRYLHGWLKT